jgi:hypothetical protein
LPGLPHAPHKDIQSHQFFGSRDAKAKHTFARMRHVYRLPWVTVMLEGLDRCVTALTPAARRVGQLARHAYRRFILPPGEKMPSLIYRRLKH